MLPVQSLSLIVEGGSPEEIWICSMGRTVNEWPGWQKCWSTVELELCMLLICWEILCR